ncbi:hypothetical protein PIB30_003104 [Stylosanthes scabra]|uniref:Uncharacterized protein n=1 Tax=Stylosanthes scabra TaxID=79078 RepID=A0ABU6Y508_9FABA|nr:hypothetical protein [Stylosanthes scabra]
MCAVLWNLYTGFTFQSPQIRGHVHLCGFGYDHLSDSYKIFVMIRKLGPSDITTLDSVADEGIWRRLF